jgi:hypothetical protein
MDDLSGRQAGGIMAGNFRLLPSHLSKGQNAVPLGRNGTRGNPWRNWSNVGA